MERLIFRNDDVNPSTNLYELAEMYKMIKGLFPDCEIWSCVTLFGQANDQGSVYPETPFKQKTKDWFYTQANRFHGIFVPESEVCSHGLYHVDHSKLTYDAQEMSIVGSCQYLKTKKFIPPFNSYDVTTEIVCDDFGIELVKPLNWKSLEHEVFNPDQKQWYFHSWRFNLESLKGVLNGNSVQLG